MDLKIRRKRSGHLRARHGETGNERLPQRGWCAMFPEKEKAHPMRILPIAPLLAVSSSPCGMSACYAGAPPRLSLCPPRQWPRSFTDDLDRPSPARSAAAHRQHCARLHRDHLRVGGGPGCRALRLLLPEGSAGHVGGGMTTPSIEAIVAWRPTWCWRCAASAGGHGQPARRRAEADRARSADGGLIDHSVRT